MDNTMEHEKEVLEKVTLLDEILETLVEGKLVSSGKKIKVKLTYPAGSPNAGEEGYLGYTDNKKRYASFVSDEKDATVFEEKTYKKGVYLKCTLDSKEYNLDYHTGGGEVYGNTSEWSSNAWVFENDKLMPRVHKGGLALCPDKDPDYTKTLYISARLSPFKAKRVEV
jgi:hypothetical protein